MKRTIIRGAKVYAGGAFAVRDLYIHGGVFTERFSPDADTRSIDGRGLLAVPGFIDIHTHGCAGVDVNAIDAAGAEKLCAFAASQGTTSLLLSVLTDTQARTLRCIEAIVSAMGAHRQICGIHLEGPFLAPDYKGAMPEALLRAGDAALLRDYQQAAGGNIRYLTLSPEIEGALDVIAQARREGIAVAIGHSGADYETAMRAIDAGAQAATHTFNAMKLLHQHFPAILGAVLESDVYCEAICDGRHLHPGIVRLLLKTKGTQRVVAVTDSIMAAGMPDGRYKLGVNDVTVTEGDAKLTDSGVRAGSTLTSAQALRNLMRFTGRPMAALLPLLTENPARLIGLSRKGRIAPGMDADAVLLDENGGVRMTLGGGEMLYEAD